VGRGVRGVVTMVGVGEARQGGWKKNDTNSYADFFLSPSLAAYGPYPTEVLSKQRSEKCM
jgi:hypothetical protein